MIPDLDIYRSAKLLVKRHGADAPIQATMREELQRAERVQGEPTALHGRYHRLSKRDVGPSMATGRGDGGSVCVAKAIGKSATVGRGRAALFTKR